MHLIKTADNSKFYRFNSNSTTAKEVFGSRTQTIDDKPIEVLQVAYFPSGPFDVIIEYIYIKENK